MRTRVKSWGRKKPHGMGEGILVPVRNRPDGHLVKKQFLGGTNGLTVETSAPPRAPEDQFHKIGGCEMEQPE